LLPYGGDKVRWAGMTRSLMLSKDWVDYAIKLQTESGDGEGDPAAEILNEIVNTPFQLGSQGSVSFVSVNYGYSTFQVFEADLELNEFGEAGVPDFRIRANFYSGTMLSLAAKIPSMDWLSLGISFKYLGINEIDTRVPLANKEKMAEIVADYQSKFQGNTTEALNFGLGYDAGLLTFFQGKHVDFSAAAKVDDVGNTQLAGNFEPKQIKQTVHGGLGLTLHGTTSALHFSLDVRDLQQAYGEPEFKRVHAGTKLTLFNYIGLSTGISHGYPTYGAEIDFLLFRLTGTYYTKEMGNNPNVNPRRIYMATLSFGTDF